VAADEDATAYVRSLEEFDDSPDDEEELEIEDADSLADEVERFLRDHDS
jgi:hypothetical protein